MSETEREGAPPCGMYQGVKIIEEESIRYVCILSRLTHHGYFRAVDIAHRKNKLLPIRHGTARLALVIKL